MVIYFSITCGFGALAAAEIAATRLRAPFFAGFRLFLDTLGYLGVGAALAEHSFGPFSPATGTSGGAGFRGGAVGWFALGAAAISLAMLVWTVFLEIPRQRRLLGIAEDRTVTTGAYGICRHPGWWWLAAFVCALCVARPMHSRIDAAALMVAANSALIWFQDRWSFPLRFSDYGEYARRTPFLVPRPPRRIPN